MTIRESGSKTSRQNIVAAARALRQRATPSEQLLWDALRDRRQFGRKIRRQSRIGHFVVDFYCASERLVVEVDGPIHQQGPTAHRERQTALEARGLRVLRVTAEACEQNMDAVLRKISDTFHSRLTLSPLPREGEGCPDQSGRGEGVATPPPDHMKD